MDEQQQQLSQAEPDRLTLERFLELAAKGLWLSALSSRLAVLLALVAPVPSLRTRLRRAAQQRQARVAGVRRVRTIYAAMTPADRDDPNLITHVRRAEIAAAAGVDPMDVSQLKRNFQAAQRAMALLAAAEARETGDSAST